MNPREKIINRRANPLLETLPEKFSQIYPGQVTALQQVMAAFEECDMVVLDAPTGTGKTVLGECARRLLKAPKTMYICHSKSLQDQFLADFDYAAVIKGRGNYPTEKYPERFTPDQWSPDHLSAEDCTWSPGSTCDWCSEKRRCPYEIAKNDAIDSDLAVANSSYFLAECNGPGKMRGRDLVIADEADTLEQAVMGHVSVEVSRRRMEKFGWDPPAKVTVTESWSEWLDEKIPVVAEMLRKEREQARRLEERLGPGASSAPSRGTRAALMAGREVRYLAGLLEALSLVQQGLEKGQPWVYTGEGGQQDRTPGAKAVSFKPSRVDMLTGNVLWPHGKKWLLMSATVISAQEMLDSLGWDKDYRLVRVPSTFPVENRRVYPVMIAPMSRKATDDTKEKMGRALIEICKRHPDSRILVHCVSYHLAGYLAERLITAGIAGTQRPVITHKSSADKAAALGAYTQSPTAVLLSPSMDRGVDLPGDLCRVQVICKIPFPNMGDRQVKARMYSPGGQTWYTVQTVRTIVQMTGRAVRNQTDYATTYILDAQFQAMIWSKARRLLPSWWVEAIDWREGERLKREIV